MKSLFLLALVTGALILPGGLFPAGEAKRVSMVGLDQGASAALAYDLDRRSRLAQVNLSEKRRRAALRPAFPSLSLSYERQVARTPGEIDPDERKVRAEASQVLWDGGQLALTVKLAGLSGAIDREELALREAEVKAQHRNLYFEALRRKQDLSNQTEFARLSAEQARLAAVEYDLGQITESDLLELKSREKESEKARVGALVAWQRSLRQWRLFIGAESESPVEIWGQLETDYRLLPPPANVENLIESARERRIEGRRMELERQKTDGERTLSRLSALPTVRLSVFGQLSGFDRREITGDMGVSLALRSTFLGNTLEGSYGLEGRRNLGGFAENQALRFGLLEDPGAGLSRAEKDLDARYKTESAARERAQFAARIRDEGEALALGHRELELFAEEEGLWLKRLSVLRTRMDLGELRRSDWVAEWVKFQEKRGQRSAATAAWVEKLAVFENLCGLGAGGLGLVRENHVDERGRSK